MQNAALQSAAPARRKRHACIDTLPKYCACHAKRKNDLPSCEFQAPKTTISCETSSTFHILKDMIMAHCVCTAHRREINDATRTRRGVDEDPTTTTRPTRREHRSNPDPNYKREPFATHSGKKMSIFVEMCFDFFVARSFIRLSYLANGKPLNFLGLHI